MAVLEKVTSLRSAPTFNRSDYGPEYIATPFSVGTKSGAATADMKRVSPCQNGYAESFNSLIRDEFMNIALIATIAEPRA